ncbi:NYN domain [Legionella lansingensis]|uniref:6-hydroxy-3-succinoylpyridine 3-monooxygenase HspA n=1 Tax=Legionella lansingensis TaxID=45067 RepID=A0A0W0VEZ7_9GAMM|nr:NYN domain-containing protein [Legionella lansingensis]KTD18716.1 6-hydroxy-3-succinoylpyridine 3-monooxygenase HspA [Legionella lansingensis]SNV57578.1 NYN domain [Legionella lansingensis]
MNNKKKVVAYVDGFNLYHGIKNLNKPYLKWLNLRSLAEKFIDQKTEQIEKVYYFSAIATHLDKETVQRHRTYIEALETISIDFVGGNFKKKLWDYKNKQINLKWLKHEEKETDVNLSIYMVRDAIKRSFDKIILITNDTDMVPAVKMARYENNEIQFKLLTPPTLETHDSLLEAINPGHATKLTEGHIKTSLLPEMIKKKNGKIVYIPPSYKRTKT